MERKKCELLLIGRIYLQEFNLFPIAQYLFSDMMHHLLQILERKWNTFFGVCKNTFSFAYIYVVLHRQHTVTVVHTCKACHIGIGDIQHQEYPVVSINILDSTILHSSYNLTLSLMQEWNWTVTYTFFSKIRSPFCNITVNPLNTELNPICQQHK